MNDGDGARAAGVPAEAVAIEAAGTASRWRPAIVLRCGRLLRGGRRPMVVALCALAVSLLLAPSAALMLWEDTKGGARAVAAAVAGPITYHELPEIVVDLKTSRSRTHFVLLSAVVEVSEESISQLQAQQRMIVAEVQLSLRDLKRQDLAGAAGIQRLRALFTSVIERHIAPASVHSVLFTRFLVD